MDIGLHSIKLIWQFKTACLLQFNRGLPLFFSFMPSMAVSTHLSECLNNLDCYLRAIYFVFLVIYRA
jgi:hypothetical protein